MDKGIGCIYKHSQRNCPPPPPSTTFVVPQHSVYTTTHVTTVDISAFPDNIFQTKPYQAQTPQTSCILLLILMMKHSLLQPPEKTATVPLNQVPTIMFLIRFCLGMTQFNVNKITQRI